MPRVVTVRMTKEMHEKLRQIAWNSRRSINLFCIEAIEKAISKYEANELHKRMTEKKDNA